MEIELQNKAEKVQVSVKLYAEKWSLVWSDCCLKRAQEKKQHGTSWLNLLVPKTCSVIGYKKSDTFIKKVVAIVVIE